MERRRRWWRWALGTAILGGLVFWIARPTAVAVEVAPAVRGTVAVTVDEDGVTRVHERYVVAAPITGRLERPLIEQGDSVRAGTPIAFISAPPLDPRARSEAAAHYQAALDQERTTRAAVLEAKEALGQADRDATRITALHQQGVVAPDALERASVAAVSRRQEVMAAEYRAQAARHDVEQARAAIAGVGSGRIAIEAPVGGRILQLLEPSERVIAAGSPIVEIGDPRTLEVAVDLLSSDATRVAPGDTMRLSGWGGDSLGAIVRRVAPSGFTRVSALGVEEQRVNVVGDVIRPPARLGDRYRVDVSITIARAANVLVVPRSALFREQGQWRLFVVDGGRARNRTVEVGLTGTDRVEITRGLDAGVAVILHPDERISDGRRVTPAP